VHAGVASWGIADVRNDRNLRRSVIYKTAVEVSPAMVGGVAAGLIKSMTGTRSQKKNSEGRCGQEVGVPAPRRTESAFDPVRRNWTSLALRT
jgi:hypothetical protein